MENKLTEFLKVADIINNDMGVKIQFDADSNIIILSKDKYVYVLEAKAEHILKTQLYDVIKDYCYIFGKLFYNKYPNDLPNQTFLNFKFIK